VSASCCPSSTTLWYPGPSGTSSPPSAPSLSTGPPAITHTTPTTAFPRFRRRANAETGTMTQQFFCLIIVASRPPRSAKRRHSRFLQQAALTEVTSLHRKFCWTGNRQQLRNTGTSMFSEMRSNTIGIIL